MTLARHASAAVGRVVHAAVSATPVLAEPDRIARRLAACRACDRCRPFPKGDRTYHRCIECGCWLDGKFFAKASLATEDCPLGRWEGA